MRYRVAVNPRAFRALANVLPPSVDLRQKGDQVVVNGRRLRVGWIGEGWLADVRSAIDAAPQSPEILAATRISPGAREALAQASIGWVDETGAAEIAIESIVVSKTGWPVEPDQKTRRWTPAVLAVAEALLCGARATVASAKEATGLSSGSCTNALRFLTEQDLLVSNAARGRYSGRRIRDFDGLLQAYGNAVAEADPAPVLSLGVVWRNVPSRLAEAGARWRAQERPWAATGLVAASLLAPYLTSEGSVDVYVGADTIAGLEATAAEVGLEPLEGGRLHLRPFPTVTVPRLSMEKDGVRIAPWPRVYADLRLIGVRGEEAAEHLREIMHDR